MTTQNKFVAQVKDVKGASHVRKVGARWVITHGARSRTWDEIAPEAMEELRKMAAVRIAQETIAVKPAVVVPATAKPVVTVMSQKAEAKQPRSQEYFERQVQRAIKYLSPQEDLTEAMLACRKLHATRQQTPFGKIRDSLRGEQEVKNYTAALDKFRIVWAPAAGSGIVVHSYIGTLNSLKVDLRNDPLPKANPAAVPVTA